MRQQFQQRQAGGRRYGNGTHPIGQSVGVLVIDFAAPAPVAQIDRVARQAQRPRSPGAVRQYRAVSSLQDAADPDSCGHRPSLGHQAASHEGGEFHAAQNLQNHHESRRRTCHPGRRQGHIEAVRNDQGNRRADGDHVRGQRRRSHPLHPLPRPLPSAQGEARHPQAVRVHRHFQHEPSREHPRRRGALRPASCAGIEEGCHQRAVRRNSR
mmetsp:Transcript_27029/g.76047  ORF Transcript_27029/g.76047 Transcript_27029/m.76047 type:complete len:211 (-) Transcript_27029:500-1132(-)